MADIEPGRRLFAAAPAFAALTLAAGALNGPAAAEPAGGAVAQASARSGNGVAVVRIVGDRPPKATVKVKGPRGFRDTWRIVRKSRVTGLRLGRYRLAPKPVKRAGTTYTPQQSEVLLRVGRNATSRAALRYTRSTGTDTGGGGTGAGPTPAQPAPIAPATPPPAGMVADVLNRINAARAAGLRCDGSQGPALPPIGYSAELGRLADKHADDYAAGRSNDFLADVNGSGFTGAFVAETAVVCPKIADPDGVLAAMRDWSFSCTHLFDPAIDRIGIAYRGTGEVKNAWVLAFGRSSSA